MLYIFTINQMTDGRFKNFCFTINNWNEQHVQCLREIKCRYVCWGKEIAPTTGTPHLQCAIVLDNASTMRALTKRIPGASFKVCDGTPKQNRVYCSKSGDFEERGDCPVDNKSKGEQEKERWATALLAVEENRLEDVDPQILAVHLKQIEYAVSRKKASKRKLEDLDELKNEWHYGPPKCGKSAVQKEYPGCYKKMTHNKWWDGYDFEEVVFIDDFADVKLLDEVLNWADLYPFRAEFKGGSILIRPKRIIVTAQYHPSYYAGSDVIRGEALTRRFSAVEHKHDPNYSGAPGNGDERGGNSGWERSDLTPRSEPQPATQERYTLGSADAPITL